MAETQFEGIVPSWSEGDRLAKALRHAHVSVGEMADFLGVSRNTISNYTSGRTAVDKRTRMLWAQRTGVDLRWIETGEAPIPSPGPGVGDDDQALRKLTDVKRSRSRRAVNVATEQ